MALTVSTDRRLVRAGARSIRYLTVRYTAPDAPRRTTRRPIDLALVIDKSGSMAGPKLALARQAARRAVEMLGPDDLVALVAYDSIVSLLAPGALLTAEHRARLLSAIDELHAGSMTNLSGGWLTGCEQVAGSGRADSVARTLLLSDGLANEGITDHEELFHHAEQLRTRGVVTSSLGVGADFDERLMEGMARSGGGNFYYLEHAEQIPDYLASELGEALEVVARGVTLELTAESGVEASSLDGRPTTHEGQRTRILLRDLVAREEVEAVIKLSFPRRELGARLGVTVRVNDADLTLSEPTASVSWEYADHAANDRQERELRVDVAVAQRYAARARKAAAELNRAGNLGAAQREVQATARRIRMYAGVHAELHAIADSLERESERHVMRYSASMLKAERFLAYNMMEAKQPDGRKRRNRV